MIQLHNDFATRSRRSHDLPLLWCRCQLCRTDSFTRKIIYIQVICPTLCQCLLVFSKRHRLRRQGRKQRETCRPKCEAEQDAPPELPLLHNLSPPCVKKEYTIHLHKFPPSCGFSCYQLKKITESFEKIRPPIRTPSFNTPSSCVCAVLLQFYDPRHKPGRAFFYGFRSLFEKRGRKHSCTSEILQISAVP